MRYRSIGGLMLLICVVACGLISLRFASHRMMQVIFDSTYLILVVGALRSRFASDPRTRSWWFGFALFGGANFVATLLTPFTGAFLTGIIPEYLTPFYLRFDPNPMQPPPLPPGIPYDMPIPTLMSFEFRTIVSTCICMYTTLVLGWIGGTIAGFLHSRQERAKVRSEGSAPSPTT